MIELEIYGQRVEVDKGEMRAPGAEPAVLGTLRALVFPLPFSAPLPRDYLIARQLVALGATVVSIPPLEYVEGRIY